MASDYAGFQKAQKSAKKGAGVSVAVGEKEAAKQRKMQFAAEGRKRAAKTSGR